MEDSAQDGKMRQRHVWDLGSGNHVGVLHLMSMLTRGHLLKKGHWTNSMLWTSASVLRTVETSSPVFPSFLHADPRSKLC